MKPVMLLCIFHREKTPSLRIWPSGHFRCYGCGEAGHVMDHAELAEYSRVPCARELAAHLEAMGQTRLPGF